MIRYPLIGVCGSSCRLCPDHHARNRDPCAGCKAGDSGRPIDCPIVSCALGSHIVEFCWECQEYGSCRHEGRRCLDERTIASLVRRTEDDVTLIRQNGVAAYDRMQQVRERLLLEMVGKYDEGRSADFYLSACAVLDIPELDAALTCAWSQSAGLSIDAKARLLQALIHDMASRKSLCILPRE